MICLQLVSKINPMGGKNHIKENNSFMPLNLLSFLVFLLISSKFPKRNILGSTCAESGLGAGVVWRHRNFGKSKTRVLQDTFIN